MDANTALQPATVSKYGAGSFAPYVAISIGLSFAVCLYLGYVWSHRSFGAEAIVIGTLSCLEAAVFAYVLAGRKTVRSGIRFAFWMALMSVLYLLLELRGH